MLEVSYRVSSLAEKGASVPPLDLHASYAKLTRRCLLSDARSSAIDKSESPSFRGGTSCGYPSGRPLDLGEVVRKARATH